MSMISTLQWICSYPNCGRNFPSKRSLPFHEKCDPRHNPEKIIGNRFSNHADGGAGNKRHSIPYEFSKDVERNEQKIMASGPQYVDLLTVLKSMIAYNNVTFDENCYSCSRNDETKMRKKSTKQKLE